MNQYSYRSFCFKKGLLWVGWILRKNEESAMLYADNTPYETFEPELEIVYLTLGFSEKRTCSRIRKQTRRLMKGD